MPGIRGGDGPRSLRLLVDEQVPLVFSQTLRALGFDILDVKRIPELLAADDVDVVLQYAKRHRRILLSTDNMEDRDTRHRLNVHLTKTNTGKVLTVRGGPEQGWSKFVGKVIYHLDAWTEFFDAGPGWFIIGDLKADSARGRRPHQLPVKRTHPVRQGEAYLAARDAALEGPPNERLARRSERTPGASELLFEVD